MATGIEEVVVELIYQEGGSCLLRWRTHEQSFRREHAQRYFDQLVQGIRDQGKNVTVTNSKGGQKATIKEWGLNNGAAHKGRLSAKPKGGSDLISPPFNKPYFLHKKTAYWPFFTYYSWGGFSGSSPGAEVWGFSGTDCKTLVIFSITWSISNCDLIK